jgi:phenylpyruvate tautomerase PptA (4-oxalocrotonate tautomerase family)
MPLVKFNLIKGTRSSEEIKKLADVIRQVMLSHFNAPERDRYQIRAG